MKRDLPLLMSSWLNAPLAVSELYGVTAAAVFAGRLDISSVQSMFGKAEKEELAAIAAGARIDADAKRARWKAGTNIKSVSNIAVIEVYGALTRTWGVGPYSGSTGYDGIRIQLEDALANDEIDGVWLDISSGGGTTDGLYDLVDTIFAYRSTQKPADRVNDKPIWAMAADYAFSAAYAIGTAADRFYCPPNGGCASIGVITMHTSYQRALEEAGIDVTVFRYPELKFKATDVEQMDEKTAAHIMEQLVQHGNAFQDRVVRNMRVAKSVVAGTKGLDYTGTQAKAIGLVTDSLPETIVWEMFRDHVGKRRR